MLLCLLFMGCMSLVSGSVRAAEGSAVADPTCAAIIKALSPYCFFIHDIEARRSCACWYDGDGYKFHNQSLGWIHPRANDESLSFAVESPSIDGVPLKRSLDFEVFLKENKCGYTLSERGNVHTPVASMAGKGIDPLSGDAKAFDLRITAIPFSWIRNPLVPTDFNVLTIGQALVVFCSLFPSTSAVDEKGAQSEVPFALLYLTRDEWDGTMLKVTCSRYDHLDVDWRECHRPSSLSTKVPVGLMAAGRLTGRSSSESSISQSPFSPPALPQPPTKFAPSLSRKLAARGNCDDDALLYDEIPSFDLGAAVVLVDGEPDERCLGTSLRSSRDLKKRDKPCFTPCISPSDFGEME